MIAASYFSVAPYLIIAAAILLIAVALWMWG